jgi:hypothetical protein
MMCATVYEEFAQLVAWSLVVGMRAHEGTRLSEFRNFRVQNNASLGVSLPFCRLVVYITRQKRFNGHKACPTT